MHYSEEALVGTSLCRRPRTQRSLLSEEFLPSAAYRALWETRGREQAAFWALSWETGPDRGSGLPGLSLKQQEGCVLERLVACSACFFDTAQDHLPKQLYRQRSSPFHINCQSDGIFSVKSPSFQMIPACVKFSASTLWLTERTQKTQHVCPLTSKNSALPRGLDQEWA